MSILRCVSYRIVCSCFFSSTRRTPPSSPAKLDGCIQPYAAVQQCVLSQQKVFATLLLALLGVKVLFLEKYQGCLCSRRKYDCSEQPDGFNLNNSGLALHSDDNLVTSPESSNCLFFDDRCLHTPFLSACRVLPYQPPDIDKHFGTAKAEIPAFGPLRR